MEVGDRERENWAVLVASLVSLTSVSPLASLSMWCCVLASAFAFAAAIWGLGLLESVLAWRAPCVERVSSCCWIVVRIVWRFRWGRQVFSCLFAEAKLLVDVRVS